MVFPTFFNLSLNFAIRILQSAILITYIIIRGKKVYGKNKLKNYLGPWGHYYPSFRDEDAEDQGHDLVLSSPSQSIYMKPLS